MKPRPRGEPARWLPLLLIPILLLAAGLRLWHLQPGIYGDEAESNLLAQQLAQHPGAPFSPAVDGHGPSVFVREPLFAYYLFAAGTLLLGPLGPVAVSALAGVATVALAYVLASRLAGPVHASGLAARTDTNPKLTRSPAERTTAEDARRLLRGNPRPGLLAALFLAVFPPHVAASRMATPHAVLALAAVATLVAFAAWLALPTRARAALWGGCAAAAAMSLTSGWTVLLAPVAILVAQEVRWRAVQAEPARAAEAAVRLRRLHRGTLAAAATLAGAALLYLGLVRRPDLVLANYAWHWSEAASGSRGLLWLLNDPQLGLLHRLGLPLLLLAAGGWCWLFWRTTQDEAGRPGRSALLVAAGLGVALAAGPRNKEWFDLAASWPLLAVLAALGLHAGLARLALPSLGRAFTPTLLALALVPLAIPAHAAAQEPQHGPYGAGLAEAAAWIHAEDPGAGQATSGLGRLTLLMANGQPAWSPHASPDDVAEAAAGHALRYVVIDPYAGSGSDFRWCQDLVIRYHGSLVHQVPDGTATVLVYRLHPDG